KLIATSGEPAHERCPKRTVVGDGCRSAEQANAVDVGPALVVLGSLPEVRREDCSAADDRHAAEQNQELPPAHSITSSASPSDFFRSGRRASRWPVLAINSRDRFRRCRYFNALAQRADVNHLTWEKRLQQPVSLVAGRLRGPGLLQMRSLLLGTIDQIFLDRYDGGLHLWPPPCGRYGMGRTHRSG